MCLIKKTMLTARSTDQKPEFRGKTSLSNFFLIFVGLFCLLCNSILVEAIEPGPLWTVINKTLVTEKLKGKEKECTKACTKVVIFNTITEKFIKGNHSGDDGEYIKLNIDDAPMPGVGFISDKILTELEVNVNLTINKAFIRRIPHCILVVSLVNTTQQQVEEFDRMSSQEIQDKKLEYTLQMAKLLQFRTPVRQRVLVLVRFGERSEDFGQCRKTMYQRYPRRLVPLWEQVLFDFFPYARAIHATTTRKTVITRKEETSLIWMCEDIMERIEAEETCKLMTTQTPECKTKLQNGDFSISHFNISADCRGYTPRM